MRKYVLCLANSKKFRGRCLAGIGMRLENDGFHPETSGTEPKWIRPVSDGDSGEVPTYLVSTIRLLDVFEFEMTEEAPDGFHTENVRYQPGTIRGIRRGNIADANLETLLSKREQDIFGNDGRSLSEAEGNSLDHSILLIEPTEFSAYFDPSGSVRGQFRYRQKEYVDFPITDLQFRSDFEDNQDFYRNFEHTLLTISLTGLFDGRHWKLIAGVVSF